MRPLLLALLASSALARVAIFPLPPEIQTARFAVTVNGQPAPVAHAASNYYFVSFELQGVATVSITAPSDDYWEKGVDVQPWRHNIRPTRAGRTITFRVSHPIKLSIARPGDYSARAEMLFLFANAPEVNPPHDGDPGVRYYGPGIYRRNIDAKSGDTIYLAGGAVILGSLNLWGVENVRILGRGIVIYDGPQTGITDDGWEHRPNWHAIVMDNARNIEVNGIVCVVRSRTWMIQMQDSRQIRFDNVKVIGGCPGNANQDGMDFIGTSDAVVRDCFIRASDDDFSLVGNWLGYGKANWNTPGNDVSNILVENSVLSTSISNTVRMSWQRKEFESSGFILRDSDVIHMGMGGCKVPFALLEIWADPGGRGDHSGLLLENIRLEDWYSLIQLRQPNPGIHDVTLRNIWALDSPQLVPSALYGAVSGVTLENVKAGDLPPDVWGGAAPPAQIRGDGPQAAFTVSPGVIGPHREARFTAAAGNGLTYEWMFGDGSFANGPNVRHAFPDAEGTLLDGSGRFRVLLKVTDAQGRSDWASHSVVVTTSLRDPDFVPRPAPGLHYRYFEGFWDRPPKFDRLTSVAEGVAAKLDLSMRRREDEYALVFNGYIQVPVDGGYTFSMLSKDGGKLEIGGAVVATGPAPVAQVCGSAGNQMQLARGTIGLKAGLHAIRVAVTEAAGPPEFSVKWEGPGVPQADIPPDALFHAGE